MTKQALWISVFLFSFFFFLSFCHQNLCHQVLTDREKRLSFLFCGLGIWVGRLSAAGSQLQATTNQNFVAQLWVKSAILIFAFFLLFYLLWFFPPFFFNFSFWSESGSKKEKKNLMVGHLISNVIIVVMIQALSSVSFNLNWAVKSL